MADIVLFGPPGCGKGTQAAKLSGYRHISTGALFREAVAAQNELGREIESTLGSGKLISDAITLRLVESICDEPERIVWDGFPRTVEQARAFGPMLARHGREIGYIVNLEVPPDVLLWRILQRNQDRPEDNPETFALRMKVYHEQTAPVLAHYGDRVISVDGTGSPQEIADNISALAHG